MKHSKFISVLRRRASNVGPQSRAWSAVPACVLAVGVVGFIELQAQPVLAEAPGATKAADTAASPSTVPSLAAVIAAMPKNLPRARGLPLQDAIEAAEAAEQACAARGAKVSVLVADSVGEPIVILSGNGAGVRSQLIARTKVNIVARYKQASGDVAEKANADPSLKKEAAADPNIGMLRGGGFPVMQAGAMVGAVAVSGGSLTGAHGLDEMCAEVALRRLEQQLVTRTR